MSYYEFLSNEERRVLAEEKAGESLDDLDDEHIMLYLEGKL